MSDRTALILGLGRFGGGRAAAAFLAKQGFRLRIVDRAPPGTLSEACAALEAEGADAIDWRLGDDAAASADTLLEGVDLCVINPAVRPEHPLLAAARLRGIEQTQEVNLFLEHYPGTVVFVTGTNGKSTTATLLTRCLEGAGRDVLLGGNIGRSLLDPSAVARWCETQVAVLEISSAQLSRIDPLRHRVRGAVVTRITSDHLDWHGSLRAYRSAKSRAIAAADDFVVHGGDDPTARALAPTAARRIRYASRAPEHGEVGQVDGWICSRFPGDDGRILHGDASLLVGDFHVENLAAAAAAGMALGLSRAECGLALSLVEPLQHRLQLLATVDGRRIYGNAVSTELGSTLSALRSIQGPLRWVGGGKSKTDDFASVAEGISPLVASAHLFGAAAEPLSAAIGEGVPNSQDQHLEQALDSAWKATEPGDAILFSPAFASFDQYVNFRARAAAFEVWLDKRRSAAMSAPRHATIPARSKDRPAPPPSNSVLDAEL